MVFLKVKKKIEYKWTKLSMFGWIVHIYDNLMIVPGELSSLAT